MADRSGFRRSAILVLLLALLVASLDIARLLTYYDDEPRPVQRAAPPVSQPVSQIPPTTQAPPTPVTNGDQPVRAPHNSTASAVGVGATVGVPDTVPAIPDPPREPDVTVTCASELALADSPDAEFNFLCVRDGVPVTWPNDSITLYTSGLTPEQSSALQVALPQWELQGRFSVTTVDSPDTANLIISPDVLENDEGGYAVVHYTCLATCAFDHVDVRLSTTRELTQPMWVTTILHELGHAAGLNHVSRQSQIMYPELDLLSPLAYASGDLAGLQELARIRSS